MAVTYKAYEYNDGYVWFELRSFVEAIYDSKLKETKRVIKDEWANWSLAWTRLGLNAKDVYGPSQDSYTYMLGQQRSGVDMSKHPAFACNTERVRRDFTLRADALLLWLLQRSVLGRSKKLKGRACALLELILSTACDIPSLCSLSWEGMADESAGECAFVDASGACAHMRPWRSAPRVHLGAVSAKLISTKMKAVLIQIPICDAAARVLSTILDAVSSVCSRCYESREVGDVRHVAPLMGQKRKRRGDEDYLAFVVEEAKASGAASSASAAARVLGGKSAGSSARRWSKRRNAIYVASAWATFNSTTIDGAWSLAPDATRLGQPAKDLLLAPLWSARHQVGYWCTPQERVHKYGGEQ
jgi:hypothetical protein